MCGVGCVVYLSLFHAYMAHTLFPFIHLPFLDSFFHSSVLVGDTSIYSMREILLYVIHVSVVHCEPCELKSWMYPFVTGLIYILES